MQEKPCRVGSISSALSLFYQKVEAKNNLTSFEDECREEEVAVSKLNMGYMGYMGVYGIYDIRYMGNMG